MMTPDVSNGIHSWVISTRSEVFTNIPRERFDRIGTAMQVLNPEDCDLVMEYDSDRRYHGNMFSKGTWETWVPAEHGVFKIAWTRTSGGLVFMTDNSSLTFANEEWSIVCDVLASKVSVEEFMRFKLVGEIGALRKRVEELAKLARAWDDERRRLAAAISKATGDLYATRRFVKSSRVQKIREDLEAALRSQ